MDTLPPELARRLLYILYLGWVEARARSTDARRVFDLADALHNIPCYLARPTDWGLDCIRQDLDRFRQQHGTNYVQHLDRTETGTWFWEEGPQAPGPAKTSD
jgi:hypothetical protein